MRVKGSDLRAGDVWQGDFIESIGGPRMIPAKVLLYSKETAREWTAHRIRDVVEAS